MHARTLGTLHVSVIGLGCNNFGGRLDEAATRRVVDAAIEAGVTFFDTADMYGSTESERFLGRILKGRREQVVLATKFGMPLAEEVPGGAHPDYIRSAIEASLERLQTDHVDLYQLHRPDPNVPLADTLGALAELVEKGWVREIGCSNFNAAQLDEANALVKAGAPRFVSVQNEYSLMHREPESGVLDACARLGIGFLPYFPLMSGLLSGKYRKGAALPEGTRVRGNPRWESLLTEENLTLIEALTNYAESRGFELLDLAFAWLLARPQVASVIAGAMSPEQVTRNAKSVSWLLSDEERDAVERILTRHPATPRSA
jgi:aryl-alcohol dehydrogenase-like predicted oxidoreductase